MATAGIRARQGRAAGKGGILKDKSLSSEQSTESTRTRGREKTVERVEIATRLKEKYNGRDKTERSARIQKSNPVLALDKCHQHRGLGFHKTVTKYLYWTSITFNVPCALGDDQSYALSFLISAVPSC